MRKDELRKLRALPATKAMMEKGKRFKDGKDTGIRAKGYDGKDGADGKDGVNGQR